MSKLTPIEVELLRNGLTSICDEMFLAIMKSAYSTNIKERHDHSAAIFDAQGRVVVQGESLPLHLASMLGLVEVVLDRYGVEEINPGDMFLSNDPFVGRGSHLPDVAILAPIFRDGELVLFVSNIAILETKRTNSPSRKIGAKIATSGRCEPLPTKGSLDKNISPGFISSTP